MSNQCEFYGDVAIVDLSKKVRAQCPVCESIRTLQARSYGWYFPHHKEPDTIKPLSEGIWRRYRGRWVHTVHAMGEGI